MITRIRVEGSGSLADLQDEFERVTLAVISAFGTAVVHEEVFERQRTKSTSTYKGRRVILTASPIEDGVEVKPKPEVVTA